MTTDDQPTGMGASTADFVRHGIVDLECWVETLTVDAGNREEMFSEWQVLDDARAALIGVCHDLEEKIALSIPQGQKVELGEHRFQRTTEKRYVKWQSEDLMRAVIDSRLVDPETGEVALETPAMKLLHVYGMYGSQARQGALKARNINPDEFAELQWGRKKLRDVT